MDYRTNIMNCFIQKLKVEKVISQKELAEKVNVLPAAVTKWLKGETCPSIEIVPIICKIFNISLNQFFGINEDRIITPSELKYIDAIEKHPELKAILDKYTDAN